MYTYNHMNYDPGSEYLRRNSDVQNKYVHCNIYIRYI